MPHPVFDIVPKDEEEEHIAADVQPSSMQKHSSNQREVDRAWRTKREMRWHSWERCLWNTMRQRRRYHRICEHECRGVGPKRYLVKKYNHVYRNEPPCDPGKASSWPCIVLDRNHLFSPLKTGGCIVYHLYKL